MSFNGVTEMMKTFFREGYLSYEGKALPPAEIHEKIFRRILTEIPCGQSGNFRLRGEFGFDFVPPKERLEWEKRFKQPGGATGVSWFNGPKGVSFEAGGQAHTLPDYARILKIGLKGIFESIPDY